MLPDAVMLLSLQLGTCSVVDSRWKVPRRITQLDGAPLRTCVVGWDDTVRFSLSVAAFPVLTAWLFTCWALSKFLRRHAEVLGTCAETAIGVPDCWLLIE